MSEAAVADLLDAALERFALYDFRQASELLDRVPTAKRTDEIRKLHVRCQQLKNSQKQFEDAARRFENGDYDLARDALEEIPERVRTEESQRLLQEAKQLVTFQPLMKSAHQAMRRCDFAAAVDALEEIPKDSRTERVVQCLQEAYEKKRKVAELQLQIDEALAAAAERLTHDAYDAAVPLLEDLIELAPALEVPRSKLDEVRRTQKQIERRDRIHRTALEHVDGRDYRAALDDLAKIDEPLFTDDLRLLRDTAQARLEERERLVREIREDLRGDSYDAVPEKFDRLGQLHWTPLNEIAAGLQSEEIDRVLVGLADGHRDGNRRLLGLLDGLLGEFDVRRTCGFLEVHGCEFVQAYPSEGAALHDKLCQILDDLAANPQVWMQRLELVHLARKHLGADAGRVDDWIEFEEALAAFDDYQRRTWERRECLVGNERTDAFEAATARLFEAAARVLPHDGRRWETLTALAGRDWSGGGWMPNRARTELETALRTGTYRGRRFPVLTVQTAIRATIAAIALGLFGFGMQILFGLLFGIGGLAGYGLVAFLAALYTFFCYAANKIL